MSGDGSKANMRTCGRRDDTMPVLKSGSLRVVWIVVIALATMRGNASAGDGTYAIDYGCTKLNAAFEKTRNSDKYQEITYLEQPDEDIKEQFRSHFDEAKRYEKFKGPKWKVVRRKLTGLNEFSVPIFYGQVPDEFLYNENATVIRANWRRGPNKAISTHWISKTSGKVIKSERTFTVVAPDYIFKSGQTAINKFTYDTNLRAPKL